MRFKLTIDCDNAAFGDDVAARHEEIGRILYRLHQHFDSNPPDDESGKLRDLNGNTVGEWKFAEVDVKSGTRATTRGN